MDYTLDTSSPVKLTLTPKTKAEAKLQNLYVLLNTPQASVPCYREFGLDMSYMAMPMNIARTMLVSAIADAFESFFPELRINRVGFDEESDTAMNARIEVSDNE